MRATSGVSINKMVNPTIEVNFIANVDEFTSNMVRATQAVKAFAEACKGIPWYVRWLFALQAILTSNKRG